MYTSQPFPYFEFVIASTVGIYLWETYLNYRQRSKLRENEASDVLLENALTTNADFAKSQHYGLDKNSFTLLKDLINLIEQVLLLSSGYALLWNLCVEFTNNVYYESLLFIIVFQIFETLISMPFSYYSHFVIEEKHGFNKQTIYIFLTDIAKQIAISVVITSIIIPIMMWIIDYFGDSFVYYVWIFVSLFLLLLMWLAPNVIMPCFYTFEALDEETHCKTDKTKGLKKGIECLAQSLSFPLKKVFVMDGSSRSNHSNAFQYGFCGNKRIVLFDTLLAQMSKEEICSVMCHELGHWKYSHTLKGLFITEIQLFVMFSLFKCIYLNRAFYNSFGFQFDEEPLIVVGLLLFSHLLSPISVILNFMQNYLTRSWEYEADEFAVKMKHGHHLYNALIVLFKENKAKLDPDSLYEAYHHNHPSALPRLNALKKFQNKDK